MTAAPSGKRCWLITWLINHGFFFLVMMLDQQKVIHMQARVINYIQKKLVIPYIQQLTHRPLWKIAHRLNFKVEAWSWWGLSKCRRQNRPGKWKWKENDLPIHGTPRSTRTRSKVYCPCIQPELEFESVGFLMREENRSAWVKTSRSRLEH